MTTSTFLTTAEAAEILGVSVHQVKKRLARGHIAGAFKSGGNWLIPAPVTYVNLPYPDNPHQRGRPRRDNAEGEDGRPDNE